MQVWRQIQPCQPPPSCSPGYPLRSTYGMFRCFRHFRGAALSVAQRVIQDDRRRNLVFYRNQRIGKRAHRHTDLRKVPATLPFPYPARDWRAVALNRWRLSRRQGVQTFGRQDNRRHGFEYLEARNSLRLRSGRSVRRADPNGWKGNATAKTLAEL